MERIYLCTNEDRYLKVLEVVEPYVSSIEGPTDGDPSYLLTCDIPVGLWNSIMRTLRSN